jgi:hypothetical protein
MLRLVAAMGKKIEFFTVLMMSEMGRLTSKMESVTSANDHTNNWLMAFRKRHDADDVGDGKHGINKRH